NGEIRSRSWLVFSESKGAVFCVPCLFFGNKKNAFMEGFHDWKNAAALVKCHENSHYHKTNLSNLKTRGNERRRVDNVLVQQLNEEILYWKNILKRVIAVVKSLAGRGLPFRGHMEEIENTRCGNFLASLKLIAEFDPFLAKHLQQYAHEESGSTSYVSKTIYEELIKLVHDHLLQEIIPEVKSAKYFGLSVDSTPDIAHADQLTIIIRYVKKTGEPVERFIGFIANIGHKAEQLADTIVNKLHKYGTDIKNCRGQSYDKIDLTTVTHLYSSLANFLGELRSSPNYFEKFEKKAIKLCNVENYSCDLQRKKIRKVQYGESRSGETQVQDGQENFRINVYNIILDTSISELKRRSKAYSHLQEKFGFLNYFLTLNSNEIIAAASKLVENYLEDLEDLCDECLHFNKYLQIVHEESKDFIAIQELSNILRKNELYEVYSNIEIAFRIFHSIPSTNCTGERSFSTLKRVKSYLRANMNQERLNYLAILTIHAELLQKLNSEEIITEFAAVKARRV
ncbi:Zinc finger MYM-type protein 1, partial [Trachymyrmex cornetzi]